MHGTNHTRFICCLVCIVCTYVYVYRYRHKKYHIKSLLLHFLCVLISVVVSEGAGCRIQILLNFSLYEKNFIRKFVQKYKNWG